MSSCRSCRAPVRWVITERGRRMPLDSEPYTGDDDRGLFVLRTLAGVEMAIAVTPAAYDDEPRYRSHFATCPDRADWRREP